MVGSENPPKRKESVPPGDFTLCGTEIYLFVVSQNLFVELYRRTDGGEVDVFIYAVDAVELLHVDIDRSKAQRARADIAHPAGVGSGGEDERGNCGVREHVSRAAADIFECPAACISRSVELVPVGGLGYFKRIFLRELSYLLHVADKILFVDVSYQRACRALVVARGLALL